MRKPQYLATILFALCFTYSFGQKLDKFESTIVQFEEEDKRNGLHPESILFTGSSSVKRWETLEADFAPIPVLNRGFGGSTIPEVTYYADRIILPHKPKTIVFYCGENDLSNDEAEAKLALKSFKKFSKYLDKNLPETKLFFIAIKPSIKRWHYWSKLNEANQMIEKFIEKNDNYYFIDVAEKMLDKNGIVLQDIFVKDNLHLNEKGYKIWTETIKSIIESHYAN